MFVDKMKHFCHNMPSMYFTLTPFLCFCKLFDVEELSTVCLHVGKEKELGLFLYFEKLRLI